MGDVKMNNKGLRCAILTVLSVAQLSTMSFGAVYVAGENGVGPGYDNRGTATESTYVDRSALKSKATGYEVSHVSYLDSIMDKIKKAETGGDGTRRVKFNGSRVSVDEIIHYWQYNAGLGETPRDLLYMCHSGNDYELIIKSGGFKGIDEWKEADGLVDEYLKDKEATLESIRSIFNDIASTCEYEVSDDVSVYKIFKEKKGQCHSFSLYFNECLRKLGVESYYVLGYTREGGFHAWNSFVLDGKTYTCDLTYAVSRKGQGIDSLFVEDGSMTLGDGRTIKAIY